MGQSSIYTGKALDRQLQDTIKQFWKILGTLSTIDRNTKQFVKGLKLADEALVVRLIDHRIRRERSS